jgi:hypothetical protein
VTTKQYKRPPVVERAVSVTGDVSEQAFQERVDTWAEAVQDALPVHTRKVEWEILIRDDNQVPVLDEDGTKMRLVHQFWPSDPKETKASWCLQLWPSRLAVNLRRVNDRDLRSFQDLDRLACDWIPRWGQHFGVRDVSKVVLEYCNLLSVETVPEFATKDVVHLDKLITVFSSIPGPAGSMITNPYKCMCGLLVKRDNEEYRCQVRVEGLASAKRATVQVHFRADTADRAALAPAAISPTLSALHGVVREMFEGFFTTEAKEVFGCHDLPNAQR